MNLMKTCRKCGEEKSLDCFYKQRNQKDGHNAWCKSCVNGHRQAGRDRNRVEHRRRQVPETVSKIKRLRRLQLTDEQYEILVQEAEGMCIICNTSCDDLVLDHNHKTGAVRGLLCSFCNTGLGFFRDDPKRLKRAIEYLRRHAAEVVEPA